jgi:hypothetical protein
MKKKIVEDTIDLAVTNTWQLVGDEQSPHHRQDTPLLPAGLPGPVGTGFARRGCVAALNALPPPWVRL